MKMIADMTVIRGNGECLALMNSVVNEEMRRLNEQHRRETTAMQEEMRTVKRHRDGLLSDRLGCVLRRTSRREGPIRRAFERIVNAWAIVWALGVEAGLWLREGDRDAR